MNSRSATPSSRKRGPRERCGGFTATTTCSLPFEVPAASRCASWSVVARADGPGEAERRGALAFLVRSVGTDSHRLAHTGATRYVGGRAPGPSLALSHPHAQQIRCLASLGKPVRRRLLSSASSLPDARAQNVIAAGRRRER